MNLVTHPLLVNIAWDSEFIIRGRVRQVQVVCALTSLQPRLVHVRFNPNHPRFPEVDHSALCILCIIAAWHLPSRV